MKSISVVVVATLAVVLSGHYFFPSPANATVARQDVQSCDQATAIAARETGVPKKIMKAIARTESGVTVDGAFVPWPWTINVEGRGVRLQTQRQAVQFFSEQFSRGARNIDVGCFQVNHRWHGSNFDSVSVMLDPVANARYAAGFLKSLHDEFGDWTRAVGAFHSRNSEFSQKYLARFLPILEDLDADTRVAKLPQKNIPNTNDFPLLHGKARAQTSGSLFPVQTVRKRSLLNRSGGRG